MEWIPGSDNEKADYISCIVDFHDWMVDPMLFQQLDALWGLHTVDCFASFYNTQLPRFSATIGILVRRPWMHLQYLGKEKVLVGTTSTFGCKSSEACTGNAIV